VLAEIIRKEILNHLMSLRFAIACVLCFVVILCSLSVRLRDYGLVLDDYIQNTDQVRTYLHDMDHPWWVVYRGLMIHQRPNALKIFARGVEDKNGISVQVTGHRPVQFFGAFPANPLVPLFPAMDMINFVGIIMSLLAIVFGYDAICGEKQQGTLRLMLSYSVPRDTVLLGKWIGGFVTLIMPFLLAVIAAVTIVLVQPNVSLSQSQSLKLVGVFGLAILYIAAIYSLALWVSCLTPRPSTSVMILVTIWLVMILAVPNLSPYLAQSLRPTEDPMELEMARTLKTREVLKRQIEDKMPTYKEKPGLTRRMFRLQCRRTGYVQVMQACLRIDEAFERHLDGQIRLSRWISRVSPFSCFAMAATELTDTGLVGKRRFIDQVRDYQQTVTEFGFNEWIERERIALNIKGTDEKMPDWPTRERPVPRFTYTGPAGSEYFRMIVLDAGILAAVTVVFFMLSFVGFLRYDVR